MKKSNTKKKHQLRDIYGKRDRALKLRCQKTKRSTSLMAKGPAPKKHSASGRDLLTIEAIRAFAANILKDCKKPLNRYDAGFQAAVEEIGRLLDPGGYSRDRSMTELVAVLQKASAVKSKAHLQSVDAFRDYLEKFFASVMRDPSDSLFLYGYEDANWRVWRMVTGGKHGHPRSLDANVHQHLAALMAELGWSPVRVRCRTQGVARHKLQLVAIAGAVAEACWRREKFDDLLDAWFEPEIMSDSDWELSDCKPGQPSPMLSESIKKGFQLLERDDGELWPKLLKEARVLIVDTR